MKEGSRIKKLAWVIAVEMALMQSVFAQDEVTASEPAPESPVISEAPVADAVPETIGEVAPADETPVLESAVESEVAAENEPVANDGPRSRLLEEIVVTAQKREQNLQEVPSSVQAFSAAQLDAQGVSDIKDMQLVTPGLTYDSMASYSIIFIRGVGGDAFQAGIDSSVATYIDGLYLPFTFSSAQALGDVRQVEVLKGPQGTLYGRNAIAGAIKVELKEPCSDEYCGEIFQQFGNFNDTKTKGSFSGPVPYTNNTLRFGISGLYQQHDAHVEFQTSPDQPNSFDYQPYRNAGHRAVLRWEPNDSFDLQGTYYDLRSQDADSVITVLTRASPTFSAVLTPITEPHKSGNPSSVGVNAITRIATGTATARWFDAFDVKLVYGNISAESTILFDYDSAPEPVLDISAVPNTADSNIAELIFSSNPANTPEWFEWIGGVYYEDTLKTGRYPIKVNPTDLLVGTGLAAILGNLPEGFPNILDCDSLGVDCNADANTNTNPFIEIPLLSGVTTDAISAYAQFTFHVTEQASVVLGGRASSEDRDLVFSGYNRNFIIPAGNVLNLTGEDIETGDVPAVRFAPQSHTWRSFTPNVGLNFKTESGTLLYYRYAEAFKSGNFNGLNVTDPPDRIEPELAASNEIGVKSELFDNSVKLNAAIFTTKVSNAQVQNLSLASGGVTSLQNAANYTVQGAEIESAWYPLDGLVLSLSAVYLDGEYGQFIGRAFRPESGFSDETIDFSGNKTVRTPEWTGTLGLNYTFPLVFGLEAEAGANVYYNDGFFYDPLNTLVQESYQIVGAQFGVFDPRSNIRLTFYGKNLTDDVYFTQSYRQDFGDTVFYGQRRTFGAYATWSFGS